MALVSSERGLRIDPDLPLASAALRDAGFEADTERAGPPVVPTVWNPTCVDDLPDAGELGGEAVDLRGVA